MTKTAREQPAPTYCKACGKRRGSIPLTAAEEVHHFGHVLTEAERGFCSHRCWLGAGFGFGSSGPARSVVDK